MKQNPNSRWVFIEPTFPMAEWVAKADLDSICVCGDVLGTGVRGIPIDLSTALATEDPNSSWLKPAPTTISYPVSRFISILRRWAIKGPDAVPRGITLISPAVQEGETIASPKGLIQH